MTGKKRFGVSIDSALADMLDTIAKNLGLTRSQLVERALTTYLEDHAHLVRPHKCTGLLLLTCNEKPRKTSIAHIIETYRDVIVMHTHTHVGANCIDLFLVNGPSDRIAELHKNLRERVKDCATRYIPLFMD